MKLQTVGSIYFVVFALGLLGVALWSNKKKVAGNSGAAVEHFLGGRNTPMFVLAMSYCAGAVSAGSFIGDPAYMSTVGWPYYWFTLSLVPGLVIPGLFIIRKLRLQSEKYNCMTINEYIGVRYKSKFLQIFIAVAIVLSYSMVLIAQFKGAAILLEKFTGLAFAPALIIIAFAVLFYTNIGGLRSVAWTDFVQGIMMCILAAVVVTGGLIAVGGIGGLESSLIEMGRGDMVAFAQPFGQGDLDVIGILGMTAFSFFVMFSQPYISSRYIALKDISRKSIGQFLFIALITGYLFNLMFLNGLTGRVLFPDAAPDYISVTLAAEIVPPLLSGLLMLGFFSAIVSTATSILLIISQSVGRDIYGLLKKDSKESVQVKIGNYTGVAVIAFVIIGNLYRTPAILQLVLLLGLSGVGVVVAAPLYCGVLWDKSRTEGAIASAVSGAVAIVGMNVVGLPWTWSILGGVVAAFAAMFIVSTVLNNVKGVDIELQEHASIEVKNLKVKNQTS